MEKHDYSIHKTWSNKYDLKYDTRQTFMIYLFYCAWLCKKSVDDILVYVM